MLYPCNNNSQVCVGYQPRNRCLLEVATANIYCAEHHTGPLCEVCINSNTDYYNPSVGRCTKCPSKSSYLLRAFKALVIASAAIVISWLFLRQLSTYSIVLTSLSQKAKFKILVGFYQVISSFRAVFGFSIDDRVEDWFNLVMFSVWIFPNSIYTEGLPRKQEGSFHPQRMLALHPLCRAHHCSPLLHNHLRKIERRKINRHQSAFWNKDTFHRYCSLVLCSSNSFKEYIQCEEMQSFKDKRFEW